MGGRAQSPHIHTLLLFQRWRRAVAVCSPYPLASHPTRTDILSVNKHYWYYQLSVCVFRVWYIVCTYFVPNSVCLQGGQSIAGCGKIFSFKYFVIIFWYHNSRVQIWTQQTPAKQDTGTQGLVGLFFALVPQILWKRRFDMCVWLFLTVHGEQHFSSDIGVSIRVQRTTLVDAAVLPWHWGQDQHVAAALQLHILVLHNNESEW